MNHIKHYNCWGDLPHDGKKAARRRDVGNINLFIVPSLHPKQESDKTAVEAPPDVIAADTAMEELTECPALPASAEDEAAGWDWDKTNIDEFEEEQ